METIPELVLTACQKKDQTVIRVERIECFGIQPPNTPKKRGINAPAPEIVIVHTEELPEVENADISHGFTAYLTQNGNRWTTSVTDTRKLRFWFESSTSENDRKRYSAEFFKELIVPENFPKDYTSFIEKLVYLLLPYHSILRVELSITPETATGGTEKLLIKSEDNTPTEEPAVEPVHNTEESLQKLKIAVQEKKRKLREIQLPTKPEVNHVQPDVTSYVDGLESVEDEDEEPAEPPVENYITVITPPVYDYQYLPEVPVSKKKSFTFRVKAKGDAYLALSSVYGDTVSTTYEIQLGGWKNRKSCIKAGGQGQVMDEVATPNILDSGDCRQFWVCWADGLVQVGRGNAIRKGVICSWKVPENRRHAINCLAVATGPESEGGEWEFIEYIERSTEETSQRARKLRYKELLMWSAKKVRLLETLQDAFPNAMGTAELLRCCRIKAQDMMTAVVHMKEMQKRGLVIELTRGVWMRAPSARQDPTHKTSLVDELPVLKGRDAPTIAVLTTQFCEKQAADAMMEKKISYIKHKKEKRKDEQESLADMPEDGQDGSVGEAQVFTVGEIGTFKVVTTKLSRVSSVKGGSLATGNAITRLLGTFAKVEHVFIVGVGGGVPNYGDFSRHARLGDVVVSLPTKTGGPLYYSCHDFDYNPQTNRFTFQPLLWTAKDNIIQRSIRQLRSVSESSKRYDRPWEKNITSGLKNLHGDAPNFDRPLPKTDKLYAFVNNEEVQVEHPKPTFEQKNSLRENQPQIRHGPVAGGRFVARNIQIRGDFARTVGVACYDGDFDVVMDSLAGSRIESFIFVRGVCDYSDGAKGGDWQPYAALAAAAYMKALITILPSGRYVRS